MGSIRILDDHIANQIAAGEVVERPSSVVKELVENAIDAGSSRIDVSLEEGGLQLIRVTDNGSGIAGDDLQTAFLRHATSKIVSGKDLFHIRTLGFRGEALPSIAAVSKVECATATDTGGLGRRLVIEGGTVVSFEDAASSRGTDILIKELFYNTPARLKYMKTIQTELGHVSDYIYRLAMAHPGIAFTLKHNGNTLLQTLGNGDLLQVVAAVYGTALAKQMVPVSGESLDYAVIGYVSKPELTRANRSAVSTFINGRYVKNYVLANAVMNAFHTLLPINRFPAAALHLTMDPSLLDVNVHPAKLEVRFSKEAELMQCVEQAVREALGRHVLIPKGGKTAAPKTAVIQERMELYRPSAAEAAPQPAAPAASPDIKVPGSAGDLDAGLAAIRPAAPSGGGSAARVSYAAPTAQPAPREFAAAGDSPAPARAESAAAAVPPAAMPQRYAASGGGSGRAPQPAPRVQLPEGAYMAIGGVSAEPVERPAPTLPAFPQLAPIGQLHGTYLVAQNEDGLYLIDQHAAHERINFEHYYELFGRPVEVSQELLVPITLDFTPAEAEQMKTRLSMFEQVGVFIEHFGGNTFIVRAYPHWLPAGEEKDVLEEMAEWVLSEKKTIDLARLREKSSALCSCKASIKANQSQSLLEMEALLDRLAACRNPYTCPHGRPIVVSFSSYELEKMFKRVM
ncbi:DNA mismatch repair endonuclease MutL [Paenibacillus sp. MBLB4367]|uniref:DNA mismatch repair endonuclease MutL n=1 Tax=Paenibacillus sp. MBLB4367 TaxID=3384767 RepID=UPI003908134D